MTYGVDPGAAFGVLLMENTAAARFYQNCTIEQKQAIHHQVNRIESPDSMQAFIEHLPSAAL